MSSPELSSPLRVWRWQLGDVSRLRRVAGRGLIAVGAVAAPAGAFAMDWNETHVFNPRWPPHAKFHNAQTMSLAVALAGQALWRLTRPQGTNNAAVLAATYWATQLVSVRFPGAELRDPEQPEPPRIGPAPIDQRLIALTCLVIVTAGAWLANPPAQPSPVTLGG